MITMLLNTAIVKMLQDSTSEFPPAARLFVYLVLLSIIACSAALFVAVIQEGAPNIEI